LLRLVLCWIFFGSSRKRLLFPFTLAAIRLFSGSALFSTFPIKSSFPLSLIQANLLQDPRPFVSLCVPFFAGSPHPDPSPSRMSLPPRDVRLGCEEASMTFLAGSLTTFDPGPFFSIKRYPHPRRCFPSLKPLSFTVFFAGRFVFFLLPFRFHNSSVYAQNPIPLFFTQPMEFFFFPGIGRVNLNPLPLFGSRVEGGSLLLLTAGRLSPPNAVFSVRVQPQADKESCPCSKKTSYPTTTLGSQAGDDPF